MNAIPSSIALFEFLDKTHADIKAQLHIMRAVVSAIEADGWDLHTREQARRLVHQGTGWPRWSKKPPV